MGAARRSVKYIRWHEYGFAIKILAAKVSYITLQIVQFVTVALVRKTYNIMNVFLPVGRFAKGEVENSDLNWHRE